MARVFITGAAAFVRNDRLDILAANEPGYARYVGGVRRQSASTDQRPNRFLRPPRSRHDKGVYAEQREDIAASQKVRPLKSLGGLTKRR